MDRTYKNIGYFFIIILVFLFIGFYKTYFSLFPSFTGIRVFQHIHGILLFSWFVLFIVQPFLIRSKKPEVHKRLGSVSYFLVPLIILSIFFVSRDKYLRMATTAEPGENISELILNMSGMVYFGILFLLAMVNKHKPDYHMRYQISSSLLVLGPGIGRIMVNLFGVSFPNSVLYSVLLIESITIVLLFYDIRMKYPIKPYFITLLFLISFNLVWAFRLSAGWQTIGNKLARCLF